MKDALGAQADLYLQIYQVPAPTAITHARCGCGA